MKALFKEQGSEFRVGIVADPAVQEFIGTHASALDSTFEKVEMSEGMRRRLTRSNYIFSGIKAFHELNEAFPSLLDENGNRKPFERFLNDVQTIDNTYNSNYLRAEYNFVAGSAEMAARWESFMEDGDRYNLQYRTQRDDKVRPEHAALDRVTLPPSDSFWEEFYPPNGWNCFTGNTPVLTLSGWRDIKDIKRGDLVIGGSGEFRKVIGTHSKTVDDELVRIISKGGIATCTKNHRFCTSRGWIAAAELQPGDIIIQVGKNTAFYKIVNAIRNTIAILLNGGVSPVRERKSVPPLTINDKVEGGDVEIDDVAAHQKAYLEWKGFCRQIGCHDFFGFAEWLSQCAHAFGMLQSGRFPRYLAFLNHFFPSERGGDLKFSRYASNKIAVGLGFSLANMSALKRKTVVYFRKVISSIKTTLLGPGPLRLDSLASMSGLDAAKFKNPRCSAFVDIPVGGKPSDTSLLHNIPLFNGIKEIHSFDVFNSMLDFLCKTFCHNLYILVEGKINIKKSRVKVYNLSVDIDESYIVPVGITHNCRCTVVQVRKSKCPATNHDEAMRLGDEALQRDTKGIFRFNAGKEGKSVPDYNPYTIRRCRDCDVAKGKAKLAFVPDNQVCEACVLIRKMVDEERSHGISPIDKKAVKAAAKEWAERHIPIVEDHGGQPAQRMILHNESTGLDFVLNKKFFGETFSNCVRANNTAETMELAVRINEWLPNAVEVGIEPGRDHSFSFKVMKATFEGREIVVKAKMIGEELILYTMRVYG